MANKLMTKPKKKPWKRPKATGAWPVVLILVATLCGCAMTMRENSDGSCTLVGWGGGEGTLEGKCTVKKGMFDLGGLRLEQ